MCLCSVNISKLPVGPTFINYYFITLSIPNRKTKIQFLAVTTSSCSDLVGLGLLRSDE